MTIGGRDVDEAFAEAQRMQGRAGNPGDSGRSGAGPEDDIADEGYDEAQRAEILEVEGQGPLGTMGIMQTDLSPDYGGGDADDDGIGDDADRLDAIEDTGGPFTRKA